MINQKAVTGMTYMIQKETERGKGKEELKGIKVEIIKGSTFTLDGDDDDTDSTSLSFPLIQYIYRMNQYNRLP